MRTLEYYFVGGKVRDTRENIQDDENNWGNIEGTCTELKLLEDQTPIKKLSVRLTARISDKRNLYLARW